MAYYVIRVISLVRKSNPLQRDCCNLVIVIFRSHNNLPANQKASSFWNQDKMKEPGDQQSRILNLGNTILSFSLPMLFCNGFSVELSKFEANIERDGEKEVEMSTLFLQLTQVLMSPELYHKKK